MIALGIILPWEPKQAIIYTIWAKSLHQVNMAEHLLLANNTLLINFDDSDERLFVQAGIPTISMQTFLSMCCGYAVSRDEMNHIFKRTAGIHYTNIFGNRQVNFSILYSSPSFWNRIAKLICEGMDMLEKQGMKKALELEVKITSVLHRMFDEGYSLDTKRVAQEYWKLQGALSEIKRKMKEGKGDISELLYFRQKAEDKIRRIPYEIYNAKRSKAVISCNFRSIGTDTFRITTNRTNIQGLPKAIRRCFLPRHGEMLIEYDIVSSQIIILACLSGEDSLIQSYTKGVDLYVHITSVLTGKRVENVTEEERSIFKRIILQMLYGAGISTIQRELKANGINFSYTEVKEMQKRFYQSFLAIREYSDKVKTADRVILPTGRKWNMQGFVEPYKRLSYIMQMVESVILREVLVLLDQEARNNEIWLYLCIHDSVFVEANSVAYAEVRTIVRKCFNQAMGKYLHRLKRVNVKEDVIYDATVVK